MQFKFLRAMDLGLPIAHGSGGRIVHTFEYICVATGDMYLNSWMGDSGPWQRRKWDNNPYLLGLDPDH